MPDDPTPGSSPGSPPASPPGGTPPGGPRPPVQPQGAATPPPPPPGYPPMMMAGASDNRRSGVLSKLLASLVTTVLILSLLANFYLGFMVASLTGGPGEVAYASGDNDKHVVILPVTGMITQDTANYIHQAMKVLDDSPPDAVVLRVESGGGGVTVSDEIHHELERYRHEHPDVKFVASFGNAAASGGYYIATPVDFIMAEHTTITGSIGVMAEVPTFAGTMDKLGVKVETLIADGSPKKQTANNMFRDWDSQDRAVVKRLLNSAYTRFVNVVWEGRKSHFASRDKVEALATGRIFTAAEAKKARLVDAVGYLDDAIAKANQMVGGAKGSKPTVTIMRRPRGLSLAGLVGFSHHGLTTSDLGELPLDADHLRAVMDQLRQPRFSYRADLR